MPPKFKQMAARLTGLSTPLFGISWEGKEAERSIAADLILRLEDRRVLYNTSVAEVPDYCIRSVLEVRATLSDALVRSGGNGPLADHIRAMGAACRRFLDRVQRHGTPDLEGMSSHGHYLSWEFQDALGQLRGIVGVHLALMSVRYEIELAENLMTITPMPPSNSDLM